MPTINQVFYISFTVYILGFALNAFFAFRHETISQEARRYWGWSVTLMTAAAFFTAIAAFDFPLLLVPANLAIVSVFISLSLLFRALNRPIEKRLLYCAGGLLVAFAIVIAVMIAGAVGFAGRMTFMISILIPLVGWQMREIHRLRKQDSSIHLASIFYLLLLLAVLMLVRGYTVYREIDVSVQYVYQEGSHGLFFRLALASIYLLEFFFIASYFQEKLLASEKQARLDLEKKSAELYASTYEKQRIQGLLEEREQLIKTLMRTNKTSTTGALSASLAHELNQPLGATLLNVQHLKSLLESRQLTPEIEAEILNHLETDTLRASQIVQSVRSIFTEQAAPSTICDLHELLHDTQRVMQSELRARLVNLDLYIEPATKFKGNSGQIQQVVLNLMGNAIQALTEQTTGDKIICISAFHNAGRVVITVEDNGPGIPAARQKLLFSLLESDKPSGLGLGLWLCHHIITNHQGTIRYEPAARGGARFVIELPAAVA